ncbi:Cysteine-rich receptor-like protein kinase 29 [Forsythia ovata]|uniref:Cysteine-rich receptor-like protein kinase 29 n=1 Tax=Forsythia ovata TaxID=205694 RepID=A0ABD1R6E9_9LAMI
MSSWKWLSNFIFLICLINLVAIVKSQFPTPIFIHFDCLNNGSYTSNSTYKTNLNTLLSSVSPNIDTNGFYNASRGENSDRVNVIALCRADLQPSQCRDYVDDATGRILEMCPGQKQAILWHEFCVVRYSNEPIFGTLAYFPNKTAHSGENVSNSDVFYQELNVLLDSLRDHAAFNSSPKKFAGATRDVPDYRTIYAFEQCTPDITSDECGDCLTKSAQQIRECCDGARGVRILRPSCYLRFETDPFYNATMVETVFQPPTPPMPPPPQPPGKGSNKTRTIIIIVIPIVVCLILALCIAIYLKTKKSRKQREEIDLDDDQISTVESLQYEFGTIRDATNNFSDANKLGQGGFGVVYKGKLPKGNEIAVKRLSRDSGQGDGEFKNEVLLVARLQHRNLVRLLGFAVEGTERLLIYEWVQNGSLDHFIFDPNKHPFINWEKRYIIIGGVAKGLLYLHEDSRLRIIHRDLKASNVLLDGEMNAKISDFGMARLFVPNETQHSTSRIVGTYGYMAPEYVIHGQFSVKSDVFSFGVLVLEIISGQKTYNFQNGESMDDLLSCVWKNWNRETVADIIDPALRTSSGSLRDIMRCIHIGLLCVQENAADRPTMASVVLMLSSFSLTLPAPSQPAFFMSSTVDPEISVRRENDLSTHQSDNNGRISINDASMSELHPR